MRKLLLFVPMLLIPSLAWAQGNYEIQVYGAETVAPGTFMQELHSNYTVQGQRSLIDGVYPTNHQEHETSETTFGINDWSEVGFYIFTSLQDGHGWQWVGDHIRPRVRVPDSWHWPVGVSISTEFGYQRPQYSPDTVTWEIRPIVDKYLGRWYMAFNPALERTLHGPDVNQGLGFAPAYKLSYDFTKVVSGGFEYYGDFGKLQAPAAIHDQQQQLFVVTDLNTNPNWEINIGIGMGATGSTDHLIVKGILGRHFNYRRHSDVE